MIGPGLAGAAFNAYAEGYASGLAGQITFSIETDDGVVVLAPTTANIIEIDAGGGFSVYRYTGNYPATVGDYVVIWQDPDGVQAAEEMLVAATAGTVSATPHVGPCQPWTTAEDIVNCCAAEFGSDIALDQAADVASAMLYELTGHKYSGVCMATVRPCASPTSCWAPGFDSWYADSGCSCQRLSRIRLAGYPIREIVSVTIDGEIIAPDEYRLERNSELVRLADAEGNSQRWPGCQRMDIESGEGTFFVSYLYGLEPPHGANGAAAQLACAIAMSCPGSGFEGECEIPAGTVRVARQGITIDTQALGLWLIGSLRTGMPLVDSFLAVWGSSRKRRTALMVPEQDPWPLRVE